ncbi:hypothetical protein V6N11_059492 [Hibiscus sabdariffa]|uniref:Uncharacterized protein n=2 Tax=Hibiscus sabdariffa TaxID=183260 RepID=A0ABR2CBX3_9ROSI
MQRRSIFYPVTKGLNQDFEMDGMRFDYLSDHKNPLFEDLFPLFGIEHQLQRFDKRLVAFYHIVSNEVLP